MAVASLSGSFSAGKRYGSSGWENCPLDVLMLIFERLKPEDLATCLLVNEWWRDAVNYMAQHRGLWQDLAQISMMNKGVSFRRRSTRPWRDLYINSLLWLHVHHAKVRWSYERSEHDIRYLHVYKDILIVQTGEKLLQKYYLIKDMLIDITKKLHSEESIANSRVKTTNKTVENNIETVHFNCDRIIKKLVKEGPFRRFLVLDQDCYYVLDEKNILRCSKWDDTNKRWLDFTLARYYGCNTSISDINVYDGEVYMLLKTGLIFKLDRQGRNFVPDQRINVPTTRLLQFSRLLSKDLLLKSVQRVSNLDLPEYSTEQKVMFQKACAVISVPNDKKFKMNASAASGNVVLEYPHLSCAMQHGEVLLLGFKDGKVEISIPKRMFRTSRPELTVHVQDCPGFSDENPEIVALDVQENEDSHNLFVATRSSVYRLEITYEEHLKAALGLRTDFTSEGLLETAL